MSTHTTINIGKRALVTGASSGIGAAIARELAALGVDLVLTARRRDALDAVAASCKGVKVEIVTADLGKPDAARAVGRRDRQRPDRYILINNAGFASTGAYQSVPNMALYAASKAFVRNFSEGLRDEHRGTPRSARCCAASARWCPGCSTSCRASACVS